MDTFYSVDERTFVELMIEREILKKAFDITVLSWETYGKEEPKTELTYDDYDTYKNPWPTSLNEIQQALIPANAVNKAMWNLTNNSEVYMVMKNELINTISTQLFTDDNIKGFMEDTRIRSLLNDLHSSRSETSTLDVTSTEVCRNIVTTRLMDIAYRRAGMIESHLNKDSLSKQFCYAVYVLQGVRLWGKEHFKLGRQPLPNAVKLLQYLKILHLEPRVPELMERYGHIECWDVRKITEMQYMAEKLYNFNSPIGAWDVSNVTDMMCMFEGCEKFNMPIGAWNVQKVKNMTSMFYDAQSFNQPVGDWNVSNVELMDHMFYKAISFNQSIENWKPLKLEKTYVMFRHAASFQYHQFVPSQAKEDMYGYDTEEDTDTY